jgi:hypothetical protein
MHSIRRVTPFNPYGRNVRVHPQHGVIQATAVLDAYVAANGLLLGENGGSKNAILSIDGPLCDALFAPRKGQPPPPEPRPTQVRGRDGVRVRGGGGGGGWGVGVEG